MKGEVGIIGSLADMLEEMGISFYDFAIQAGFPAPGEEVIQEQIDLNKYLINDKECTFFVRVTGESMIDAHIVPGCILIVDKSLLPSPGDVIIARMYGDFTVKYYRPDGPAIWLVAANEIYHPVLVHEDMEFEIWGIVTTAIYRFKKFGR